MQRQAQPGSEARPHRRTRLIAAVVAAATILCLLALVIIVAREQIAGSAIVVQGEWDDATGQQSAVLEAQLARDPHDDTLVAKLAALASAERRWSDAAQQWAKLAKLDPLHPDARFEQARALLALGDAQAARAALAADERSPNPRVPTAREDVLLARAALMRGDVEQARKHAAAASDAAPKLRSARLLEADLAFLDNDDERAGALYGALVDDPESAAAAGLGLAQLAMRAGEREGALARLQAMPADTGYQALSARAALYRQLGRDRAAIADYRALLEREGPIADVVVPLAELRAAQEDAASIRALRLALTGTTVSDLAARHYLQAIEAYLAGEPAQARDYLAWSEDFFGGRDLYRWMALDLGAELGDRELVDSAVRALTEGVVGQRRRARAAAVLVGRAAAFANTGDAGTADHLASAALALLPDLPQARLVAARAALLQADPARATALAQPLAEDAESRPAALEILGRAALRADRLAQAAALFKALAEASPGAAVGSYWQGVAAARAGDLDSAQALLRLAYQRRPEPRVESALLDVLMRSKDWAASEALARGLIEAPSAAARARGQAYLGGILRARGEPEAAAAAYAEASDTDPGRAAYALAAGDLLMALQRWDDARRLLADAAERHPDNRYLAFKRALLAQRAGWREQAEQGYRGLLAKDPVWALPMVNLSELLGTTPEAVGLARRAAELAPDWPDAQWNLARRFEDSGDDQGALAAARAVLALTPEHVGAQSLLQRLGGSR